MEMDASLKEYQAALDAQFEERKAMILSQEEKDRSRCNHRRRADLSVHRFLRNWG